MGSVVVASGGVRKSQEESGRVWNFIGRHGELDPNSKTSGEVQTRQMTICLFREPLRIQGQPPQLDSRRLMAVYWELYCRVVRNKIVALGNGDE